MATGHASFLKLLTNIRPLMELGRNPWLPWPFSDLLFISLSFSHGFSWIGLVPILVVHPLSLNHVIQSVGGGWAQKPLNLSPPYFATTKLHFLKKELLPGNKNINVFQ